VRERPAGAAVIRPRSNFDREMARLEQKRIWEFTPDAVDLDIHIATEALAMVEATDESGKPLCPPAVRLRAMELIHTIVKETFVDRTIPTVSRVEAAAAVMALPPPAGYVAEPLPGQTEQDSKAESITLLRQVLARQGEVLIRLQALEAAGAAPAEDGDAPVKPRFGLVLLRREEDDRAAG